MLFDAIRRCNASLFTDRAISYRFDQGFDHFKAALSAGVMKMVRADLASSGVMFSIDTETGFRDAVFITGAFGLGENVVKGTVVPGRVPRAQANFSRRLSGRAAPPSRRQAGQDDLCDRPLARAGEQHPHTEG